jgi:phenylacetate-CoA ligase
VNRILAPTRGLSSPEAAARLGELWWSRHGRHDAAAAAGRLRLLVRHARESSPFYRQLYAALPADPALELLPRTSKGMLMAAFDVWSTDRQVTLAAAQRFLASPSRIGQRFLGRYWIWKSSGTSGRDGYFVQDEAAMSVYDALVAAQVEDAPWTAADFLRMFGGPARAALVVATGDHFASIVSWERLRLRGAAGEMRSFSALQPLPDLVRSLQDFQPSYLAGYPSVLATLAREQAAGRLSIHPMLAWCGGEMLAACTRNAIEREFGCAVMNEYGASESLSIAHECREGWQHLHDEWTILEPVDRHGDPVPAGTRSSSVLLTNLANWVQPIIRYDLGDCITLPRDLCPCGSALPAFRVEGRADDVLEMKSKGGDTVRLAPLAVTTVIEEVVPDVPFQVARVGSRRLAMRFACGPAGKPVAAWARKRARAALGRWIGAQGLDGVEVVLDPLAPRADAASGKTRAVVDERRSARRRPFPAE